jgi:uncharacterized Zn finger protein (UPF0148 family)
MLRKFGTIEILAAAEGRIPDGPLWHKTGHRAVFSYLPKPGFIYVRSRAISSRCNDNYDMFPAAEIKQAYQTFIGKPVFVNHINEDHRQMRGLIIDAALHEDINPDKSPDTWVEVLMEVDGKTYPKLAQAILNGDIDRTSMGCDVKISKCSYCGNEATSPLEYCSHIPGKKGQRIFRPTPDGRKEGVLVFEICSGLAFFENSLLVEPPADPTAAILGQVDVGPGLEHLVARSQRKAAALQAVIRETPAVPVPREATPPMSKTAAAGDDWSAGISGERRRRAEELGAKLWNGITEAMDPGGTDESRRSERNTQVMNNLLNVGYHPSSIKYDETDHPYAETRHPSGWSARDYSGPHMELFHAATGEEPHDLINLQHYDRESRHQYRMPGYGPAEAAQDLHHWVTEYGHDYEDHDPRIKRWMRTRRTSGLQAEALGPKYKDPGDHPWFQANPVSADHIVAAYKEATRKEKGQGRNWYADAHTVASKIADGDAHKGAGVLAAYSPQSAWPHNMHNAARALDTGVAIGGKGSGVMATEYTRKTAQRIIDGEPHTEVLRGPKVRAFAHLIEHGGDAHPDNPHVVVDRHALSVARGRRVTDDEYAASPLDNDHYYGHVVNAYHEAAARISKLAKRNVAPHEVQATAWLVQQRRNAQADANTVERLAKGRTTNGRRYKEEWEAYAKERYPELAGPGYHTAKLAYGETRAPQDVDTLRDERCTVCGNDTAFNGRDCQVCGFTAPPKALGDPDVDKAKNLDALKQSIGDELDEVDPSRNGAPFDAGDVDEIAATGDDPGSSWLECDNCGVGLRPAAPSTEDAQPGAEQAGPADGDQCPVCGKGQLLNTGVSEQDTDEDEDEEDDEDRDQQDDTPADSDQDLPASKNSATAKYRHPLKERQMQNALAALAELQTLVEHQQRENNKLQRRVAVKDSQIQRLTAGLQAIAQHLGPEVDTIVRTAMLRKRADEQNPAQPVPEPAAEPPVESTVQTKTPEAFADVRAPGMVPGSNQDVAADAVSTAYTPGQDIPSPAVRYLTDVTAPVDGTQGPRPLRETKTNVDVRIGNPMNPQTAFPLNAPFDQAQRTASSGDLRFMASMRLARLRIQARLEEGEDLVIAQRIASSGLDIAVINQEIELLNKVSKAAARTSGATPMPPRHAVPRPAVQRTVPALGGDSLRSTASLSGNDDDLSLVLLGDLSG